MPGCRPSLPSAKSIFAIWALRRYGLGRRKWTTLGVVVGDDLESAERRFFAAWTGEPVRRPAASLPAGPVAPGSSASIIGLFPEPGARA